MWVYILHAIAVLLLLCVTGVASLVVISVVVLHTSGRRVNNGACGLKRYAEFRPVLDVKGVHVGIGAICSQIGARGQNVIEFRISKQIEFSRLSSLLHPNRVQLLWGVWKNYSRASIERGGGISVQKRVVIDFDYLQKQFPANISGRGFAVGCQSQRQVENVVWHGNGKRLFWSGSAQDDGDVGALILTHLTLNSVNLVLESFRLCPGCLDLFFRSLGGAFSGFGETVSIDSARMHFIPLQANEESGKDRDKQTVATQAKSGALKIAHALFHVCELLCGCWLTLWRGLRGWLYVLTGWVLAVHGLFMLLYPVLSQ